MSHGPPSKPVVVMRKHCACDSNYFTGKRESPTCIDCCLLFALDETKAPMLTQHGSVPSGGLADPCKVTYKFLNLPMLFRN